MPSYTVKPVYLLKSAKFKENTYDPAIRRSNQYNGPRPKSKFEESVKG